MRHVPEDGLSVSAGITPQGSFIFFFLSCVIYHSPEIKRFNPPLFLVLGSCFSRIEINHLPTRNVCVFIPSFVADANI